MQEAVLAPYDSSVKITPDRVHLPLWHDHTVAIATRRQRIPHRYAHTQQRTSDIGAPHRLTRCCTVCSVLATSASGFCRLFSTIKVDTNHSIRQQPVDMLANMMLHPTIRSDALTKRKILMPPKDIHRHHTGLRFLPGRR